MNNPAEQDSGAATSRVAEATTHDKPLSRSERKRLETRVRIIEAAERLMTEGSIDELKISDITAAADVGHGTFYLHFKTKNDVLVPIIQQRALHWDEVLQLHVRDMDDPAEVFSFCARHMARIMASDPLWRWFLQHSGVPVEDMRSAVGQFGSRDLGKGLMSGRFTLPEISVGMNFVMGGFVYSLLSAMEMPDPGKAMDQIIESMLRVLGVPLEEAKSIARNPLAPLEESYERN